MAHDNDEDDDTLVVVVDDDQWGSDHALNTSRRLAFGYHRQSIGCLVLEEEEEEFAVCTSPVTRPRPPIAGTIVLKKKMEKMGTSFSSSSSSTITLILPQAPS